MKFSYKKQILEHHLDTFGHVNNAVYLELYEEARWEFITKAGFGLKKVQETQIGPVILEINVTFKSELKNREEIIIESEFGGMKNSLISTVKQRMVKADGTMASEISLSIGIFDMKTRKLQKPSKEWLHALGSIE
ncbi:MAG: acyl-CoA thioesterase [Bacteriovoracaceae bacterium]|jgi:YbgC/YbaW family acyl-CoA thioester hydrolase|nr:acyl-CoA thioesterase [Bacteriovoracaceae bacterium]